MSKELQGIVDHDTLKRMTDDELRLLESEASKELLLPQQYDRDSEEYEEARYRSASGRVAFNNRYLARKELFDRLSESSAELFQYGRMWNGRGVK